MIHRYIKKIGVLLGVLLGVRSPNEECTEKNRW